MFGHSVLVVERAAPGGTVTTTGGGPTKTLREAVFALTGAHHRHIYGLPDDPVSEVEVQKIRARTRDVCAILQEATEAKIRRFGADYKPGEARLAPGPTVIVSPADSSGERVLKSGTIVVATGSGGGIATGTSRRANSIRVSGGRTASLAGPTIQSTSTGLG